VETSNLPRLNSTPHTKGGTMNTSTTDHGAVIKYSNLMWQIITSKRNYGILNKLNVGGLERSNYREQIYMPRKHSDKIKVMITTTHMIYEIVQSDFVANYHPWYEEEEEEEREPPLMELIKYWKEDHPHTRRHPLRWRMVSSGLLRRVAVVRTDVSEEPGASFITVTKIG
jgi:hypothetical protein